ncbi:hypothetical protein A5893_17075 [Pedobacter psychrophilus]|uniref:Uncharacterized protein n=1 Tax=Pedobacter psychrophilus TaxID=1826909 RepID=A0A179DRI8_9SPHI|nr:hypothetical protein [Pedobacter psychrophilus]OAQ43528.1 hypothetical protein A5893_17075 [Pedobacter psychrophilus]
MCKFAVISRIFFFVIHDINNISIKIKQAVEFLEIKNLSACWPPKLPNYFFFGGGGGGGFWKDGKLLLCFTDVGCVDGVGLGVGFDFSGILNLVKDSL